MLYLFDTSVLIAAFVRSHPKHFQSFQWLKKAHSEELQWAVATHSLAECYAVLTSLPVRPRISSAEALEMMRTNINSSAKIVELKSSDYWDIIQELSKQAQTGGIIYDALLVKAAERVAADKILTLNGQHFSRLLPNSGDRICAL